MTYHQSKKTIFAIKRATKAGKMTLWEVLEGPEIPSVSGSNTLAFLNTMGSKNLQQKYFLKKKLDILYMSTLIFRFLLISRTKLNFKDKY